MFSKPRTRYGQIISLEYANGDRVELCVPGAVRVAIAGKCPQQGALRVLSPQRDCMVETLRVAFDDFRELAGRAAAARS